MKKSNGLAAAKKIVDCPFHHILALFVSVDGQRNFFFSFLAAFHHFHYFSSRFRSATNRYSMSLYINETNFETRLTMLILANASQQKSLTLSLIVSPNRCNQLHKPIKTFLFSFVGSGSLVCKVI